MKTSVIKLLYEDICGVLIIPSLIILLSFMALSNNSISCFFIILGLVYLIRKRKYLIIITMIIIVIIISHYYIKVTSINMSKEPNERIYCTISDIKLTSNNKIKAECKTSKSNYILMLDNNTIRYGDIIETDNYSVYNPQNNTLPNIFNYKEYLFYKEIKYILNVEDYYITGYNNVYSLKNALHKHINNSFSVKTKAYLNALILGNTDKLEDGTYKNIKDIGLLHIFAISGLHVHLIILYLKFFLKRLWIPKEIRLVIELFLIGIYGFVLGFPPSISRVFIIYLINWLFSFSSYKFNPLDIISLAFIFLILINPFNIFKLGFQLSFLATSVIIISKKIIERIKNNYLSILFISSIVFLFTLPIIVNINNEINLLTPVLNVFYIIFVSYILLPLGYITVIIPRLSSIYEYIINIFELTVNIKIFKLSITTIGDISFFKILIYYSLSILLMINIELKRKLNISFLLGIIIFCLIFNNNLIFYPEVTFLDVNQGDSAIVKSSFNLGSVLIDTGGHYREKTQNNYFEYNLSPYYKSINLKDIDYLILTHGDIDHVGNALNIIGKIKIKNIIVSGFDDSENMKQIINNAKDNNINVIKVYDYFRVNLYDLHIKIYTYNGDSLNNKSLITHIETNKTNLLFTGDIDSSIEKEINDIDIDILKVSHHGSKYSTSEEFLENINTEYAVISVGKNTYGHPSTEVIEKLNKFKIKYYRTDINGSIKISIISKKIVIFHEYRPYNSSD